MNTKKKVTNNLIWRLLERFSAQGVTLIVSIILARILDPEIYGTIALVTVITTILQVFVDSGFSTALIQKKDTDEIDFSTVFWFNIVMCSLLYVLLFFFAPIISKFYKMDITLIVRVLGILLLISGVKSIQISYVSKTLQFKAFFFSTLGGTIVAAVVGIFMAFNGYGVWALVLQNLVNQAIDTIILWIVVKWRPKFTFSFSRLKELFGFGWKILISSLLDKTYTELRSLIIGKKYSREDLAYYKKADQFPNLIAVNINSSIDSVLLPVMSSEQDNRENIKKMTRRAIKMSSFILWPLMFGLAACSTSIISIVLTDKWLSAVPYMMIFCITYGFYPIHTANLNAIKAMGRSDLFLVLEIIKKVIGISIILITMWFGVYWIAIGGIISCFASQIINSWPNRKLLNYSYKEQMKDMLPSFILSLIMGALVYCVNFFSLSNWMTLLIQISFGASIYIFFSWLFRFESFRYCLDSMKHFIKNRRNNSNE